jgi:hypothetical protein
VIAFIEKLDTGPVDLMGHSRGGHNAMTLLGQTRDKRPPFSLADAEAIKTPTLFIGGANTKGPCDDAGTRRRLQHPRWIAGGNAPRDVGGIVGKDDWSQPLIVVLWDAADETRCVVAHHDSPIAPAGALCAGDGPLQQSQNQWCRPLDAIPSSP